MSVLKSAVWRVMGGDGWYIVEKMTGKKLWLEANCHLHQLRLPGSHMVGKTPGERMGHPQC